MKNIFFYFSLIKMKKTDFILSIFLVLLVISSFSYSQYISNPFIFSIEEPPQDGCFFVQDVNHDNKLDYVFRSMDSLYVYKHNGDILWSKEISMIYKFEVNSGNKIGAADIDGDGDVEVVALNDNNEIIIFDGATGYRENSFVITVDDTTQIAANMVLVNQRYPSYPQKRRDVLIQTNGREGISHYWESINRTLIAINLETGEEIWRVKQNDDISDGIYEGYFGQRHGGPVCADIDLDGIDEVIGGNVIDYENSTVNIIIPGNYEYLWKRWVGVNTSNKYIDHIDAIAVGDFRSDIPGLEWVISEEDHVPGPNTLDSWHTVMFSKYSIIWRKETELFEDGYKREPQNICVGNYDNSHDYCEVWNRSRFSIYNSSGEIDEQAMGQHPWIYDVNAEYIADYNMEDVLPAGFNPAGNGEGIEEVWTIDWGGGKKEFIAGMARHTHYVDIPGGNAVILNACTGEVVWSTSDKDPQIQVAMIYVADVTGDSREELILCDVSNDNYRIKVFSNEDSNQNSATDKWQDPLYSHLKQSWNYYSPGSYTEGDFPTIFNVRIKDVTSRSVVISWYTDKACDSRVQYGFTDNYNEGDIQENSFVTNHKVELTELEPVTEYHYKIISQNSKGKLTTTPDNVFRTGQSIFLINPEGGESYYLDSLVTIHWSFPGVEYGVNIEISRDGGQNWDPLFSRIVNDSTVTWRVDEPPSLHCLLKVSDEDGYSLDVTEEFMILDTTKILVFNPRIQVLEKGIISSSISVQVQNSKEESITLSYDYNLSLKTTSLTGEFSLDSLYWNPISEVTIDSGSTFVTFFYKDNTIGSSNITVSETPAVGWRDDTLKNIILLENNDNFPPKLIYCYPFSGIKSVPVNGVIQFRIVDPNAGSGTDIGSLKVFINDDDIEYNQSNITKIGKNFLFHYIPDNIEKENWVSINVQCQDSVINHLDTTYSFLTGNCRIINPYREIIYPGGGTVISETNGVEIDFPQGAVGDTLSFTIGEIDTIPQLPDSIVTIGKYYYLGPPGLRLNKKITVSLPCDKSVLKKAHITKGDQLSVYLYNFNSWRKLSVENYSENKISIQTSYTGYITFLLENDDFIPPKLFYCFPLPGMESIPVNSAVQFKIGDPNAGCGTDINSLNVFINDNIIEYNQSNITEMGKNFLFHYIPDSIVQDSRIFINIQCQDSVINKLDTTFTFSVGKGRITNPYKQVVYPSGGTIRSDTTGIGIIFPDGAIGDTLYFTLGEIDTIPQLPDSIASFGKYFYLGPPGLLLSKKITVSLPYDESILGSADVIEADQLPVYLYNFSSWHKLSVESYSDSQVFVNTNYTGYITYCRIFSTGIKDWSLDDLSIHKWKLMQNYPNPFNPNTSIKYYLVEECFVNIKVYDLLGRFIRELVNEKQGAGFHSVEWNSTDFEGVNLPSGIYLLRMEVDEFTEMRKMILRR